MLPNLPELSVSISLPVLGASVLLISLVSYVVYYVYLHPLAHIPGPFVAKLTDLAFVRRFLTGREYAADIANFRAYGPLYRCAPNVLVFGDPAWLPVAYRRDLDRGPMYDVFSVYGLFGIRPAGEHAAAKRKMAGPFSGTAVKKMEPMIAARIETWIQALAEEFADSRRVFDFQPWCSFMTYDVLSELCFGRPIGFIENRRDVDNLCQSFDETLKPGGVLMRWPWLLKWLKATGLWAKLGPKDTDKSGLGRVMRYRNILLNERLENPCDQPDILNHLLTIKDPDGNRMDLETVKAELLLVMIAGTDTTASHLRIILLDILQRPEIYQKLMDSNIDPTYLDACIKESLRFTPPAHTPFTRIVPPGGLTFGKHHVPEGYEIYASVYPINRDKALWGEDADEFKPERWLTDPPPSPEKERSIMSFGWGVRQCIGKPIAELEVRIAVKRFLEMFETELVEVTAIELVNMQKYSGGIKMRLKRRGA